MVENSDSDMLVHTEKIPKREKIKIAAVFKEYKHFVYEFDFGNSWSREIIDEIKFLDNKMNHPIYMGEAGYVIVLQKMLVKYVGMKDFKFYQ